MLVIHMHIKKKIEQNLNPSAAPEVKYLSSFSQGRPAPFLPHPTPADLPPHPATHGSVQESGEGKDPNLKQMLGMMRESGVETIGRMWTLLELLIALTYCQG